ncbi:MAG: methionine gamma-lyase family protein [Eubacteriaceae bacterium]|nr:methionine gamma-lyase family protein [Eubacteriaceae bacterium]
MRINNDILMEIEQCERSLAERFAEIDRICFVNQVKVLNAMQKYNLAERHFTATTGYAYTDEGRDITEEIFAEVFGGEKALVRPQIVSGTHAISLALFGVLRPGDEMLSITSAPYDTIQTAIGMNDSAKGQGTLKEYGVTYSQTEFDENGEIDLDAACAAINERTKVVFMQRSTGYSKRKALGINDIEKAVNRVRSVKEDVCIILDNCYGEFLDTREPLDVDVDLIAGSLIKNPGGGIAQTGGYVIGKEKYVTLAAARLTSPGIAFEVGANMGVIRSYLQGLFYAPKVVSGAIKGAILTAKLMEDRGYEVFPRYTDERSDIIQAVVLGSEEMIIKYCRGIQSASPVDSYVYPEPWDMPGYDSPIIMAAGNFVSGSSIELSADAPIKEPYIIYQQGGLTYEHAKVGLMYALENITK